MVCDGVIDRTQVKRGPPDPSPQQTGTSRTVKRYPSSSGPITSNALPSGNSYTNGRGNEQKNWHGPRNGHSHNSQRPGSDSQLPGYFNNALLPGKNVTRNTSITHISTFPLSLATSKQT